MQTPTTYRVLQDQAQLGTLLHAEHGWSFHPVIPEVHYRPRIAATPQLAIPPSLRGLVSTIEPLAS